MVRMARSLRMNLEYSAGDLGGLNTSTYDLAEKNSAQLALVRLAGF